MTKNENNDLTAFGKLLEALDTDFKPRELNDRSSRLMAITEALARLGELDPERPVPIKIRTGIIDFMREFLSAALAYHETTGKRSDLKAAEFLKSLGVATGKNKKATGGQLFIAYCANVTPDNVNPGLKYLLGPPDGFALDPDAALESVAAEFGLKGPETALQQIRAYIRAELKKAEKKGLADSFKRQVERLNLPGNPPWSYKK